SVSGLVYSPQALSRGKVARSTISTSNPARARSAAVADPAGPPPTTTASYVRDPLTMPSPILPSNTRRGAAQVPQALRPHNALLATRYSLLATRYWRMPTDRSHPPEGVLVYAQRHPRPLAQAAQLQRRVGPQHRHRAVMPGELADRRRH